MKAPPTQMSPPDCPPHGATAPADLTRIAPAPPHAPLALPALLLLLHALAWPLPARAAPPPAAVTPGAPLTAETIATAVKPKGFRYAIIRGGLVDDVEPTLLYVKARKEAKASRAVPIPKDRALLATCVAGGTVDDLVRGAIVTVRFDPKGVVRPEIIIERRSEIEVIDGAKVIDRGGSKLYVTTPGGRSRGFQIAGGAEAWASVVQGGPVSKLVAGARVRIEYDPSGRQPLKITLLDPPEGGEAGGAKDKGCGCAASRPGAVGPGAGALALLLVCLLALRRRRAVPRRTPPA